ncbi:DUF1707 SHOCT-like domain-containing protein [Propionicimonas sp.]|uniref:DUF1707 SHOCT-like domain-containing protein n=1 Tax=Propionicimonas sp. TaxID=1955623 RepID=UPI0039E2E3D4
MTQWENLPEPAPQSEPAPAVASWSGFSADPRVPANQPLRASDADRDFATRLIRQSGTEGRLDAAEAEGRVLAVARSRTFGELAPQVADLMVAGAVQQVPQRSRNRFARAALRGWLGLAMLFNAIWLMTVLTTGHRLYYWPMWPMLGTAIPVVMALSWQGSDRSDERRTARDGRWEERDERRSLRHSQRDQRRALRRGDPPVLPPGPRPPGDDDLR